MKKLFRRIILLGIILGASFMFWAEQAILPAEQTSGVEFTIAAGSGLKSSMQQIEAAGVPVNPLLMIALAQITGNSTKLKAGTYELKPGTTPTGLIKQIVRGEFVQEALTVIEGWSFRQMRQAIDKHPGLKHDTAGLSDRDLMAKISTDFTLPEGLFYPDTYLFAKNSSDLQIYKQAHNLMLKRLNEAWLARSQNLPYASAYEALIMASIVEKETGKKSERDMIAGVFVNRLRQGMLLQTDPTVIYGMGEDFKGNIRKRDLQTDTPHNTYTRLGLPPTPIALPGAESLHAAMNPAKTDALYFVARGDGSSQFSATLDDHNNAVNKYQRGR
ncbi:endolytic transglycosylase MltG [Herminiimonas sp. KBW02]|uniref:endolytic transglycosylase MltG n=1 Tax=Herminiimonas sp. KBW02 TaxID=2153363 RepID=UPI000F59F762|nr:endolytic transglycosylase MltG [Herminiimonas sp. KBW02]RQO38543.1 endolytic transglycosylase MltG [Herminiimonas sp. KBW02]